MGLLSGIADSFGFGDGGAGDAANQIQAANAAAQKKLDEAFGQTEAGLLPFVQAGTGALSGVVQGSTVGGFDQNLQNIFDSDIFRSLVDERGRAVEGLLSAGGQLRSGAGLLEAARVPTDIGLMIEQLLSGRQQGLSTQGLNTSLNLGNFRTANAGGIANLIQNTGQAEASGILSGRQTQAAGIGNLFSLGAGGLSQFGGNQINPQTGQAPNAGSTGSVAGLLRLFG